MATVEPPPKPVEPPPPPPHHDALLIVQTLDCPSPPAPPPPAIPVDATKIVLTGPGLSCARCLEPAQFLLDAANAGPGYSYVELFCMPNATVKMLKQSNINCNKHYLG